MEKKHLICTYDDLFYKNISMTFCKNGKKPTIFCVVILENDSQDVDDSVECNKICVNRK